jgi:hypothetical protein
MEAMKVVTQPFSPEIRQKRPAVARGENVVQIKEDHPNATYVAEEITPKVSVGTKEEAKERLQM